MKAHVTTLAVAALVVVGVAATHAENGQGDDCHNMLQFTSTVRGISPIATSQARQRAIAGWQRNVRSTYGEQYSAWRTARNKAMSCTNRTCTVSARPCRRGS
jgi:hypothetical protein